MTISLVHVSPRFISATNMSGTQADVVYTESSRVFQAINTPSPKGSYPLNQPSLKV